MHHRTDRCLLPDAAPLRNNHSVARIAACLLIVVIAILDCLAPQSAAAQIFTDLHDFTYYTQSYYSGQYPTGKLLQASDGFFYGTTTNGGANGDGTVFKMDLKGNLTTVHDFTGSGASTDGSSPNGDLIQATDGGIYGTCYGGGQSNDGTVWKLDPATDAFTVVYQFTGYNADNPAASGGSLPAGGVIQASDGDLYGATEFGSATGDSALYKLDLSGNFTLLHSLAFGAEGIYPVSELTEGHDGELYGTDDLGGPLGYGVLFRMDKTGANFTVIYGFDGVTGTDDIGPVLAAADGNLYMVCQAGGLYDQGTILQFNPTTLNASLIYSFSTLDGGYPYSGLTQGKDGLLYGTTWLGGKADYGTAYKTDTSGHLTVLHSFDGINASGPFALTQASDSNFYAVSEFGGVTAIGAVYGGDGSAFRMTASGTVTLLSSFYIQEPNYPLDHLIQAQDGLFYGVCGNGGAYGEGAVYRTDAAGNLSVFHSLNNSLLEGSGFGGGLVQGRNGDFYGATSYGGRYNNGTIYKLGGKGALSVLHHFKLTEGYDAIDSLLQGADGNLYGACAYDETTGGGCIFKITPAGVFSVLHHFQGPEGVQPHGNLAQDSTGVLYGVCVAGGANGYGTVFSMTTAGVTTLLHSFQNTDGAYPDGLTLGSDGFLYGTCMNGGRNAGYPFYSTGTLFKTNRGSGATSVVAYFNSAAIGGLPETGILQGPDGCLYGTCGEIEPGDTVWKVDPTTGTPTLLHSFDYTDGYYPDGGLLLGSDGVFYGTDTHGGITGGNLFSVDTGLANAVNITDQISGKIGTPILQHGVWTARLTIKNIRADKSAILGPLQFVLTGLPSGATLTTATGTVPSGYPEASAPYQTAPGGPGNIISLPYGATLTLTVGFNQNVGVGYNVVLYTGRF